MKINSLSFRLFISASFVLTAFFALVAFVLEQGFRDSAEQALKEKLQVEIYSLLSVAELTDQGQLNMPVTLQEPRFSNPGSGLYASISLTNNFLLWHSKSAIGIELSSFQTLKPGESTFVKDAAGRFVLHYSVIWENQAGLEQYYIFSVAEDGSFITHQVEIFRDTLRAWLFFIGIFLVLVQFLVLRWGLKPLRVIIADLESIESGKKQRLDGQYPYELSGLAGNLNALVSSERAHLERYRNTLADLAHSLKTPLAILTGCIQPSIVDKKIIAEQVARMNDIVEYQLQKAAAKGGRPLVAKVDVSAITEKIIESLKKVYFSKQINFLTETSDGFFIYCEEGDIYEIAGNLLDNAAKWCKRTVKVSLIQPERNKESSFSVMLQIEDDGNGIAGDKLTAIFQRGVRADEHVQGHGIGMSVVKELVEILGGELIAGKSETLGGMMWQVYLP